MWDRSLPGTRTSCASARVLLHENRSSARTQHTPHLGLQDSQPKAARSLRRYVDTHRGRGVVFHDNSTGQDRKTRQQPLAACNQAPPQNEILSRRSFMCRHRERKKNSLTVQRNKRFDNPIKKHTSCCQTLSIRAHSSHHSSSRCSPRPEAPQFCLPCSVSCQWFHRVPISA